MIGLLLLSMGSIFLPRVRAAPSCGDTIHSDTVLDSDLSCSSGNGVNFGAGGITLDCRGHSIIGSNSTLSDTSAYGIYAFGYSQITVRNCIVSMFYNGMTLTYVNHALLTNNTLSSDV